MVSRYAIDMVLGLGYLMFSSQGMGWMASRLPGGSRLSLINHAVFGLGPWLWTMILKPL